MKHPVLTKVFGIVLAIMCLILLYVGIKGCVTSVRDYGAADEAYGNLLGKISTMMELDRQINGDKFEYEAEAQELAAMQEQYDKDSAAHRMDLTTYTATEAGTLVGQGALGGAAQTMEEAWEQYYAGLEIYEQGKKAFDEGYQQYLAAKQQIEDGWREYYAGVAQLEDARAQYEQGLAQFEEGLAQVQAARAELEAKKQRYEAVRATHYTTDQDNVQALLAKAYADRAAYSSAQNEYNSLSGTLAYYQGVYADAMRRIETLKALGMDEAAAYATADGACRLASGGLGIGELAAKIGELSGPVEAAKANMEQLKAVYDESNAAYEAANAQYLSDSSFLLTAPTEIAFAETQVSIAEQQVASGQAQLDSAREQLEQGEALLGPIKEQLEQGEAEMVKMEPTIEQGRAELEAGKAQLDEAKAQLDQGQAMLDASAGQLGGIIKGLQDTAERLEDEKSTLSSTSERIRDMQTSVSAYEQLEKDYESGRVVLMRYEGIKTRVDGGEKLLSAANACAKETRNKNIITLVLRLVSMCMAIAAAVLGILGALKVFELLRKAPAAIKLTVGAAIGAIAAIVINVALGYRIMASASGVIIFALIQIALLYEKKPKAAA